MSDTLSNFRTQWQKVIEAFRIDAGTIRSGRISPGLVEDVMVDAYGQQMPVKQIAAIASQGPMTLVIQPWDQSMTPAIEKAIRESPIGVMPTSEGNLVRLNFPPLTEEKRQALLKVLGQKAEQYKIQFRQLRDDVRKDIQKMAEAKEIGEDEKFQMNDKLQKEVDAFNAQIEAAVVKKETEIMTV